jgi:hypothetical protein
MIINLIRGIVIYLFDVLVNTHTHSRAKLDKEIIENPYYKNIDPEMIERIENEILDTKPNICFDDIGKSENFDPHYIYVICYIHMNKKHF